jgi:UDP-N-acetylglucosamine 3-dehydrogenase
MPKLRTAIIGLGMMGANHARILSNLDGVELVAVADPQGDAQKVLPQIKVLNSVHKIHFLVEKPIADTYTSAVKIRDAAKSANVIGAVGHIERFNSALQEARKRVLAGELGTIYQVATRRQGPFPSRISDVGVVKDLATHDIDLTSWITGKKYLQVSANAAFRSGREHEDLISVSGLLEDSIVVSHLVNWLSPLKERKIIITGEKGTFVADTLRADLTFYENGKIEISQSELAHFRGVTQGDVHILAFEKPEPLVVEHQNFRDAVLGKPSNTVSLEEGTTTVKIADAIIESYTNKSLVKL